MENQQITPAQTALNFGIILGAYNIIVGIMLYFLEMHYQNDQTVGIINIVITVVIIMAGIIQFKKANEGFLSLSEALKIGLIDEIASVYDVNEKYFNNIELVTYNKKDNFFKYVDYNSKKKK